MRSARHPSRPAGRQRGVTLIELMAVIVMIGMFLVLAGPTLGGVLEDRHNMRAADEISGMFRIARNRDGLDTKAARGGGHAARDLAAIGDEDLGEHVSLPR